VIGHVSDCSDSRYLDDLSSRKDDPFVTLTKDLSS
jgi:hypothetical protein